jgi:hypothetical protein
MPVKNERGKESEAVGEAFFVEHPGIRFVGHGLRIAQGLESPEIVRSSSIRMMMLFKLIK